MLRLMSNRYSPKKPKPPHSKHLTTFCWLSFQVSFHQKNTSICTLSVSIGICPSTILWRRTVESKKTSLRLKSRSEFFFWWCLIFLFAFLIISWPILDLYTSMSSIVVHPVDDFSFRYSIFPTPLHWHTSVDTLGRQSLANPRLFTEWTVLEYLWKVTIHSAVAYKT